MHLERSENHTKKISPGRGWMWTWKNSLEMTTYYMRVEVTRLLKTLAVRPRRKVVICPSDITFSIGLLQSFVKRDVGV